MATTGICASFKGEGYNGTGHNLSSSGGDTIKAVLIKVSPARTFDYTQTNGGTPGTGTPSATNIGTDEASGTGYTSGGNTLTNNGVTITGTGAYADFAGYSLTSATISVTALVLINSSSKNSTTNRAISVHDFGGTQTVTSGTLSIVFPTAALATAILRFN